MHYTGMIYRPPFEANSLLLQVTVGCSHNSCSFCTMYQDVPYQVSPMEEIEEDLQEASLYARNITRVFLEGGDAFTLPGERLIEIAERIHYYLPRVKTIAMYANISNIRTKTDEELARMHELKIDELNVGLESGDDEVLRYMNKGYDSKEAVIQLDRLKRAGIRYGLNVILGGSGSVGHYGNIVKTAQLVNRVDPYLIFIGTMHSDPGCPLYDDMQSGKFKEYTIREYLEEETVFLKLLDLTDCIYFGLHPSNIIRMHGHLPEDKPVLLAYVKEAEEKIPKHWMDRAPLREGEGGVRL